MWKAVLPADTLYNPETGICSECQTAQVNSSMNIKPTVACGKTNDNDNDDDNENDEAWWIGVKVQIQMRRKHSITQKVGE